MGFPVEQEIPIRVLVTWRGRWRPEAANLRGETLGGHESNGCGDDARPSRAARNVFWDNDLSQFQFYRAQANRFTGIAHRVAP